MTKKEKQQLEMFTAVTTWFHILNDMVESGDIGSMDGSSIKVYLVIKSHTNFSTGTAFPSIELIAKKTKLSSRQVIRCLDELEKYGYILKSKNGRNNVYTLREKVSILDSDGKQHAVATWDYIPHKVKEAIAELKNAVVTGEMMAGKIIHIDQLIINVSTGDSTQININAEIDNVPEKIAALKAAIGKKL